MFTTKLLLHDEIPIDKWICWNKESLQGSVYTEPYFLDVVCKGWSAVAVEDEQGICAMYPVNYRKKLGLKYALQPLLTPYFGVLMNPDICNENAKQEIQDKIIDFLVDYFHLFSQRFHPMGHVNMPKSNTTVNLKRLQTYWIDEKWKPEQCSTSIKNHLRKAEKHHLVIQQCDNVDWILQTFLTKGYAKKKEADFFLQLYRKLGPTVQLFILQAIDSTGKIHSAGAFLVDGKRLVYFFAALDRNVSRLGGNSLLLNFAIQRAFSKNEFDVFDFEGSSLPGVERFIKGFRPQKSVYVGLEKGGGLIRLYMRIKQFKDAFHLAFSSTSNSPKVLPSKSTK